jgi:CDP-paratose 2-epimerase|tara:strand:+ start:20 stop:1045 length:1026 start_codon:yes stop_codon:yes gene_type:complete
MKILITGGCGFVGANLSIYLKKKKFKVSSLDNIVRLGSQYNLKLLKKNKIKNYKVNISNYKEIKKLPKFDLIIDCCAEAAVEVSKKNIDDVINTNLYGTINILKKCKNDGSKIIFISSSRVYPINEINKIIKKNSLPNEIKMKKLFDERSNLNGPRTIYGLTKLSSEMFIEEFAYAFNVKYIINRCGVLSGPLQFGKQDQGFVSLWIWKHLTKQKLQYIGYNGSGNQVRDVLHIDDFCELIEIQIKNLKKINNRLFTVGGSNFSYTSLKKLTRLCNKATGNKLIITKNKKTSIYDIPYFKTNNKRVSKTYGWKPKRNINQIVNDTYLWMKRDYSKILKYFK